MGNWDRPLETGLLDDYDFTVVESYFTTDQKYNNGNSTVLLWSGTTDNEDTPETRHFISLGKGWISKDGGKTCAHDSGRDKFFTKMSGYGQLIQRSVDDFRIGDLLESRGGPFESAPWIGLTFHMKSQPQSYGGGLDARDKVVPVRFVGIAGETPAAVATTSKAPTLRAQVAAAIAPHVPSQNFEAAQEAALAIPGVSDDETLVGELLESESLFALAG